MIRALLSIGGCALALAGCSGPWGAARNPAWVDRLIAEYEAEPVANPPRSIWTCLYRNTRVYHVPAVCCDQYGVLFDSLGNTLCAPDGGQRGEGDGRCEDFFDSRREVVLIWQDPRTDR